MTSNLKAAVGKPDGLHDPDGLRDLGARKRIQARAYSVMARAPGDGAANLAGTVFTDAGVLRLIQVLKTRSAHEGAAGAKVAGVLLKFIAPETADEAQVHGVSVEKLQRLAKMAGNANLKGNR